MCSSVALLSCSSASCACFLTNYCFLARPTMTTKSHWSTYWDKTFFHCLCSKIDEINALKWKSRLIFDYKKKLWKFYDLELQHLNNDLRFKYIPINFSRRIMDSYFNFLLHRIKSNKSGFSIFSPPKSTVKKHGYC